MGFNSNLKTEKLHNLEDIKMNVGGVNTHYPIGYETRRTQRAATERTFANNMGKTTGAQITGFVLHISNEVDGTAIGSSTDRNGLVY